MNIGKTLAVSAFSGILAGCVVEQAPPQTPAAAPADGASKASCSGGHTDKGHCNAATTTTATATPPAAPPAPATPSTATARPSVAPMGPALNTPPAASGDKKSCAAPAASGDKKSCAGDKKSCKS